MVTRRRKIAIWWHRAGVSLRLAIFFAIAAVFGGVLYFQRPESQSSGGFLIYLLVNVNIILLLVLAFLIGRNIVKLFFDRRKGLLGSRLRTKLVVAMVALVLVPSVLLFSIASGLVSRALEGWFSEQVDDAVRGSVEVAREYITGLKRTVASHTALLSERLERQPTLLDKPEQLNTWLEQERKTHGLFSVMVYRKISDDSSDTAPISRAANPVASLDSFSEPDPQISLMDQALAGDNSEELERREERQFVRSYRGFSCKQGKCLLVATLRVTPEVSQAIRSVDDAFRDYGQLKLYRKPLTSSYVATLAMVTGLMMFAAMWFAFYLAKDISDPLQRLAEGTRAISQGRYNYQVRSGGDDELGVLVNSFNTMTAEIRRSREESEERRRYLETLLDTLSVGVLSIKPNHAITTINAAARRVLLKNSKGAVIGSAIESVLDAQTYGILKPILSNFENYPSGLIDTQLILGEQGEERNVVVTVGSVRSSNDQIAEYVLLFDDVTELQRAQRSAAWQEVAQRVAHEIKNPLTPIQLAAQQLEKNLQDNPRDDKSREWIATILEHTASIKRLTNEFSRFVRLPSPEFLPSDLNALLQDVATPYLESQTDVTMQLLLASRLPEIDVDREQIRRVVMNLIDNALAALPAESAEQKMVVIQSSLLDSKRICFEVRDTGAGVAPDMRQKIFEPHVTTKSTGSGLGLAIALRIIHDHHGDITMEDNKPRGSIFRVVLPVKAQQPTQRRFREI